MQGQRSGGLLPGARPLVLDRRGYSRDFPSAAPRTIGYVESFADYHNVYGGSNALGVILSLPNLWFDGRTRAYVEYNAPYGYAYYNLSCELRLDDVSFAYSVCTSAGGNLGTARQRVSGFITPSKGFHTITATGFGAGGGASGAGIFYGASPYQGYLLVRDASAPLYQPAFENNTPTQKQVQSKEGGGAMAPMPVNAGNLIIVSTMGGDNQTAVSDSIGNTYIPLTSRNNGVSVWNKFYYCFSMTSHAANVVTVSVVNNQGNNMAYAVVYEGVSQYDGVDVGNLSNSASFTTTAKGLVLIAFYHTGAGSPSPGSTMTVPSSGPVNIPPPVHTGIFWYQDLWQWVTPAALVGQTVTITTSGGTALCICAFK